MGMGTGGKALAFLESDSLDFLFFFLPFKGARGNSFSFNSYGEMVSTGTG